MVPNEFTEILIKVNLEKSDEAIKAAQMMLADKMLSSALNRIYYACFYTVTALAEKHDFKTSKHAGLLQWFNKKFVFQDKIFSKDLFKVYEATFKFRQKGDYDTLFVPSEEDTLELLENAKIFIKTVREKI